MLHIKKIINVVTEFEKNILCSHTSISIKPFNQVNSKNWICASTSKWYQYNYNLQHANLFHRNIF